MPLEPGFKLGAYEIVAPIATAGVDLYKATDTAADRSVAIQVIPPEWAGASEFPARKELFEKANQALASLNHPNIRAVYEIGEQDDIHFLVLEYLEGQTLAERLNGKSLPLDEACRIAIAIGGALEKAHAAGIVHRELNPTSVMLTKDGAKLLDFGFAELRPASAVAAAAAPKGATTVEPVRKT